MDFTEAVTVLRRVETGADAMGEPTYEWEPEEVGGCLVRPLDGTEMAQGDAASALRPDGVTVRYEIAFPAGYTTSLRHCRVSLTGRGADAGDESTWLAVAGDPDATRVPDGFPWSRIAGVGRVDG